MSRLRRNAAPMSFNRSRLPDPMEYFKSQGLRLRGAGRWKDTLCPFHGDTQPSLRVLAATGAFRCMVCGAHGGDVLAFHMLKNQLSFVAAAKALGAWESAR